MDVVNNRRATFKKILNVTSGNFLEQYDFFLFGFYATYIAAKFFHSDNEYVSLMMTFTVFAAGFLMRPLGAIFLGAYVDKVGRRKGLIVTLSLMAIGTILITFVPGYETIGIIAPILVVIGRLLQGFSAGVESGGVSIYLAEIATDKNRGFITSWQSGSQQIAVVFAALLGYWLNTILTHAQVGEWGWRIPFLIGCLIIPLIFLFRRTLE
ncbi:MFS transporter, partial [Acinetobacter baumannii]